MKICKNCQAALNDEAKFCNKCGTPVDVEQERSSSNPNSTDLSFKNPIQNEDVTKTLSWGKNRLLNLKSSQPDDNFILSIASLGILFFSMFIAIFNVIGKKLFYIGMKSASFLSRDGIKLSDVKDAYKSVKESGFNISAISGRFLAIIFVALFVGIILVAIMNYITTRDHKKFVIAFANKTVLATILSVISLLLSFFAYFQFKSIIVVLFVGIAFIQVSTALQEILFTNNFGKRIKVYIAMIYSLVIYLITMGIAKTIISDLANIFR